MRAAVRAWLVALIADGVAAANRGQHLVVKVDGSDMVTSIRKYQRRNGRAV